MNADVHKIREALATLGLPPRATRDQIHSAYRDLVQVWHPDRFAHNPRLQDAAQAKLREINKAYDLLERYFADRGSPTSSDSQQNSGSPQSNPVVRWLRAIGPVVRWLRAIGVIFGWLLGCYLILMTTFSWELAWDLFDWHGPSAEHTGLRELVICGLSIGGLVWISTLINEKVTRIGTLLISLLMGYLALDGLMREQRIDPPGTFWGRTQPSPLWFRLLLACLLLSPATVWFYGPFQRWRRSARAKANPAPQPPFVRVRCPKCRSLNEENSKFCSECGAAM